MEAVAAQQRQQQAVADFEAGRVTAAQAAASAEAPATGTASQEPHGAAAHATDASVPMAIASSCRRVLAPSMLPHVQRRVRLRCCLCVRLRSLADFNWDEKAVIPSVSAYVRDSLARVTCQYLSSHVANGRRACKSSTCGELRAG